MKEKRRSRTLVHTARSASQLFAGGRHGALAAAARRPPVLLLPPASKEALQKARGLCGRRRRRRRAEARAEQPALWLAARRGAEEAAAGQAPRACGVNIRGGVYTLKRESLGAPRGSAYRVRITTSTADTAEHSGVRALPRASWNRSRGAIRANERGRDASALTIDFCHVFVLFFLVLCSSRRATSIARRHRSKRPAASRPLTDLNPPVTSFKVRLLLEISLNNTQRTSLVWTILFAVSAAGYGGIWRDTGRYREIPGDTRGYDEIRSAHDVFTRQRPEAANRGPRRNFALRDLP